MQRAHKIRLNPTPEQEKYLRQACGVARFVFNWGLAEWQRQYEAGEKPSAYILKKQFNAIRREQFHWSLEVSKCAVDTGFRNLDAAFKNFFRRCKNGDTKKGYPNFKSKKRSKSSFRMDGSRVSADGHCLKLEKLNESINMAEELRFDGEIKSATISEDAGRWYVAVNVEVELPRHEHPQESVGIASIVNIFPLISFAGFATRFLLKVRHQGRRSYINKSCGCTNAWKGLNNLIGFWINLIDRSSCFVGQPALHSALFNDMLRTNSSFISNGDFAS